MVEPKIVTALGADLAVHAPDTDGDIEVKLIRWPESLWLFREHATALRDALTRALEGKEG